jgi:hypothetical protein
MTLMDAGGRHLVECRIGGRRRTSAPLPIEQTHMPWRECCKMDERLTGPGRDVW